MEIEPAAEIGELESNAAAGTTSRTVSGAPIEYCGHESHSCGSCTVTVPFTGRLTFACSSARPMTAFQPLASD